MHPEAEQRATAKPQHASAWKAAAPDGELVFANVARLKKAMKAARTVLRTHEPSARADAACRVISRKGQHTAEIMATDGHRLCVVDVTPIRESSIEQEFDVAMPLEAVRTIANARQTTMVRIGRNGDGCVVAFGREDNRIIEQEPPYAAVAEMPRTEALKTLRASAPTGDEYNPDGICRFEIAQDGLRVWPTTHEPAVEETEPERKGRRQSRTIRQTHGLRDAAPARRGDAAHDDGVNRLDGDRGPAQTDPHGRNQRRRTVRDQRVRAQQSATERQREARDHIRERRREDQGGATHGGRRRDPAVEGVQHQTEQSYSTTSRDSSTR